MVGNGDGKSDRVGEVLTACRLYCAGDCRPSVTTTGKIAKS